MLNVGAAIYLGGKADSIKSGVDIADVLIYSGAAYERMENFIKATNEVSK